MADASSTFSFCSGFIAGYLVNISNIVPIFLGVGIGMSIKKLPEFVNYNDLPQFMRRYLSYAGSFVSSTFDQSSQLQNTEQSLTRERTKKT
jgi:hypothetical protein